MIRPEDEGYEEARKVWNGMIDKHPAMIAQCVDAHDVVLAVNFARINDLILAVRGGGHNAAGFGTCDKGLVIDLSKMKGVKVNPETKTALAQPGLLLGELDKAVQEHGLATPGGVVSSTGIAGYTLGGGVGWLLRKYGLTIDNLLSVEVVTAFGNVLKADKHTNSDLFWGIRGGGGNFGVVTEFKYQLHSLGPNILGGALMYDAQNAERLLRFYEQWAPTLPEELTTIAEFGTAPIDPSIPENLRGRKVLWIGMCYSDQQFENGRKLIKALLDFSAPELNMVSEMPYVELQRMFDAAFPKGVRSYWKTAYLKELSVDAIRVLIECAAGMPLGSSIIDIHPVEGAANRHSQEEMAFSHREATYLLNIVGVWQSENEDLSGRDWVRGTWKSLHPYSTGAQYLNFMSSEPEDQVKAAYGFEKYNRLVELKRKYDPSNLFRINQNIKP